ncbi:MAG TPA: site-specific DNA-methyltransferase [Azospirillaceae bacterium]|nr:site-specific DNA-methyltransferase [Azospirillaceae bacterium]
MSEYAFYEDGNLERHSLPRASTSAEWLKFSDNYRVFSKDNTTSSRPPGSFPVNFKGKVYIPGNGYWKTGEVGFSRLIKANRIEPRGSALRYVRFFRDYSVSPINNIWTDVKFSSRREDKLYVVQSSVPLIERCILMATDPGDLVLDPTCGSGTTAHVAEQWGRRWITIDTSRVALALARARIMGARYPYYLLADSREGQIKEGEITRTPPKDHPVYGNVRLGFVYERVPHITLKSIANNAEIDVIWDKWQAVLEPLRAEINAALGVNRQEWEVPREPDADWPQAARDLLSRWWEARIARQREIDASIAAKADTEYLYDKPYVDTSKVRVAGPFTVESLSPHRVLAFDADDELVDVLDAADGKRKPSATASDTEDFAHMILENLRAAGVQQAHKEDRITFTSLTGWPGHFICAEGVYLEGETRRRAGILIGPEFGTVARPDLMAAAREAGDAGFDVLIACAFNFDAHSAEVDRLGRIRILKARMNPDLHMAADLKSTGTGNLFVVFGEPDIEILRPSEGQLQVQIKGVDVFHPATGEISSGGPDTIAVWFVDTDYNEESFFVRHAYFLGANDPYRALKTTLKSEIDREAWDSLNRDVSRPFPRPASGRIAVKVINHLGDEVMKVFGV